MIYIAKFLVSIFQRVLETSDVIFNMNFVIKMAADIVKCTICL